MNDINIYKNSTINNGCKQMYVSVPESSMRDLVKNLFGDEDYAEFEDLNSCNTQQPMDNPSKPLTKNEKIVKTMNQLIEEGFIKYQYDWGIIKQLLLYNYNIPFDNDQSFVDYLKMNNISHKIPTADDIRHLLSKMKGGFPEWTWTDRDFTETTRRNNLAKRFASIYNGL